MPEHAFVKRICAHSSLIGRLALDKTLRGHQGCVNTIAFSHEGSVVVSGSDDCQLRVGRGSSKEKPWVQSSPWQSW